MLKLSKHDCGSFRTGEGILFRLYNGLGLTYELAAKIEKKVKKWVFCLVGGGPHKKLIFWPIFFDFRSEFIGEPQTIIEPKQDPQAGPETTLIMLWKFKHF